MDSQRLKIESHERYHQLAEQWLFPSEDVNQRLVNSALFPLKG